MSYQFSISTFIQRVNTEYKWTDIYEMENTKIVIYTNPPETMIVKISHLNFLKNPNEADYLSNIKASLQLASKKLIQLPVHMYTNLFSECSKLFHENRKLAGMGEKFITMLNNGKISMASNIKCAEMNCHHYRNKCECINRLLNTVKSGSYVLFKVRIDQVDPMVLLQLLAIKHLIMSGGFNLLDIVAYFKGDLGQNPSLPNITGILAGEQCDLASTVDIAVKHRPFLHTFVFVSEAVYDMFLKKLIHKSQLADRKRNLIQAIDVKKTYYTLSPSPSIYVFKYSNIMDAISLMQQATEFSQVVLCTNHPEYTKYIVSKIYKCREFYIDMFPFFSLNTPLGQLGNENQVVENKGHFSDHADTDSVDKQWLKQEMKTSIKERLHIFKHTVYAGRKDEEVNELDQYLTDAYRSILNIRDDVDSLCIIQSSGGYTHVAKTLGLTDAQTRYMVLIEYLVGNKLIVDRNSNLAKFILEFNLDQLFPDSFLVTSLQNHIGAQFKPVDFLESMTDAITTTHIWTPYLETINYQF